MRLPLLDIKMRPKILVVGASSAERLALMLEQKGSSIIRIITTNWRPALSGAVPDLVRQIEAAMEAVEPEVDMFEMLDNLLYMGRNQMGETNHQNRDQQGVYHVEGELGPPRRASSVFTIFMVAGAKLFVVITL